MIDSSYHKLIPYIPADQYDVVATDFLQKFYPEALLKPMPIPIEEIATKQLGLDLQYFCLSEELYIFGMTIFTDGLVDIYDTVEQVYESKEFKAKTMLIDPEAVKKTNTGCRNNTIAHECVHWFKHRLYYKMQNVVLPRYAKYCACGIAQLPPETEDEDIMEVQANGIAPRILMPKQPFIEAAERIGVNNLGSNREAICSLAELFNVSKQSVAIRLDECNLI